jgi:F0F1-type ATP synthase assembly protein I
MTVDHRTRGRSLVAKYAGLQMACAAVVALGALVLSGPQAGLAALAGGAIVALGNVVFGWRLFAPGVAPVGTLTRAWYAAEVLKWLWVMAALWLALGPAKLAPFPLLLGLIAAQVGFWAGLAVIGVRRGRDETEVK